MKGREVFAEGLKRGRASVPIDGKRSDVPVDVRARIYLEWAKRADKRTGVKRITDEELEVTGDLTIRGQTKPITLKVESNGQVKDPGGGTRAGFHAKASISRKEFGVDIEMPLEGGGVVVGDNISITLEVEAVLQPA